MNGMKWVKVVTDLYDDEKITLIDTRPDADAIENIWIRLLCLAGKLNRGGVFVIGDGIVLDENGLAALLHRPPDVVKTALSVLSGFGMIEKPEGVYRVKNWEKYQSADAAEREREQAKIRMQNYRERQKNGENATDERNASVTERNTGVTGSVTCYADVTPRYATEREREEDIDSLSLSPPIIPPTPSGAEGTETAEEILTPGEREELTALMGAEMLGLYLANVKAYIAEGGKVRNPAATIEKFWREDAKKSGKKSSGPPGSRKREKIIGGSFDTDEFFAGALRRSYGDDPNNAGRMDMSHGKIASLDDHKQEASSE